MKNKLYSIFVWIFRAAVVLCILVLSYRIGQLHENQEYISGSIENILNILGAG